MRNQGSKEWDGVHCRVIQHLPKQYPSSYVVEIGDKIAISHHPMANFRSFFNNHDPGFHSDLATTDIVSRWDANNGADMSLHGYSYKWEAGPRINYPSTNDHHLTTQIYKGIFFYILLLPTYRTLAMILRRGLLEYYNTIDELLDGDLYEIVIMKDTLEASTEWCS